MREEPCSLLHRHTHSLHLITQETSISNQTAEIAGRLPYSCILLLRGQQRLSADLQGIFIDVNEIGTTDPFRFEAVERTVQLHCFHPV